jgi:hypothetical protein
MRGAPYPGNAVISCLERACVAQKRPNRQMRTQWHPRGCQKQILGVLEYCTEINVLIAPTNEPGNNLKIG